MTTKRHRRAPIEASKYDQLTDDLGHHLANRVSDAFRQVLELASGDAQRQFIIATFGLSVAFGWVSGPYAAMTGMRLDDDGGPMELAEGIFKIMRERNAGKPRP